MVAKFDKGVSIPKSSKYSDSPYPERYPFGEMEIGESFAVPISEKKRLTSLAGGYKSKNFTSWNYTVRTVDGKARIWRIELSDIQMAAIRQREGRSVVLRAKREEKQK